jgi:predicted  nucleic acid-binding Zn-ribbon protein
LIDKLEIERNSLKFQLSQVVTQNHSLNTKVENQAKSIDSLAREIQILRASHTAAVDGLRAKLKAAMVVIDMIRSKDPDAF